MPPGWSPRRLVVVKTCCLGDALMATATIASLHERFPYARIDVAIGPWSRLALAGNPHVTGVVDTETLLGGHVPRLDMLLRVAARLRWGGYDGAIVLERSLWLGLLPLLAGISVRVGLDSGGRGATHTIGVPVEGVRHEAELYLDCARAIGPGPVAQRLEFVPDADSEAEAEAALRRAGWGGEPFVSIHPAGGDNPGMRLLSKRWPPERFAALADRLSERGLRVVLVWGGGDDAIAADVIARTSASVLALGGELSLPAVAGVVRRARLHLGNDTGVSHLATAVGTPTVVVFGPSDERRYGPFGRRADGSPIGVAVAEPPLAPNEARPAFFERGTEGVAVQSVWNAVESLLKRGER